MSTTARVSRWFGGILSILIVFVIFIVPFIFILLTASKTKAEAADRLFTLPSDWRLIDNLVEVIGRVLTRCRAPSSTAWFSPSRR